MLTWLSHRLAGPPITHESLVTALLKAGVNVAIGVVDEHNVRHTRFEVGWVCCVGVPFMSCFLTPIPVSPHVQWLYRSHDGSLARHD
jgi:hypothetical protein